ncbi:Phosphatidate phosphatase PPAPDC1B [Oopsacas minuta]|uniref:Phosphatidate phosphatase PPAPDC1B n=1 Tax=Oopsacas minuta TaxID=111878 RepID=A0AAV7JPR7_9METZ|nr:Phosphatidate phosphatase PPAPDC1B [Oopsacas minuta]
MHIKPTDNYDLNSSFVKISILLGLLFRCTLFILAFAFVLIPPSFTPIHRSEIIYFSYQHKYFIPNSISLYFMILLVPLTSILISSAWRHDPIFSSANAIFSLSGALSVTSFLVSYLQVVCANRSPDFVSRCWPDGAAIVLGQCTGDMNKIHDGLRSFPSGIASWSMCNLFWTSLFISEKLGIFSSSGKTQFWKLCIFIFINYSAVLISLIPFNFNLNFGVDILAGCIIGLITAATFYLLNYSSLLQSSPHPLSQRPSQIKPILI